MSVNILRLKVSVDNSETRRFSLEAPVTYVRLRELIGSVINRADFTVLYTDDESELVTIASDHDLKEAVTLLKEMNQKALKLNVITVELTRAVAVAPVPVAIATPKVVSELPLKAASAVQAGAPTPAPSFNQKDQKVDVSGEQKDQKVDVSGAVEVKDGLTPSEQSSQEAEKEKFEVALKYVGDQFAGLQHELLGPEIIALVQMSHQIISELDSGKKVTWEQVTRQCAEHAPLISSLPCFHGEESVKFLNSLEVIAKFFTDHVDSGLLYPIPPHLAPLIAIKSERVLKGIGSIDGLPLQLQIVLEHLANFVGKLETVESEPVPKDYDGKEVVHVGVQCDVCGVNPLVGNRYKCTACHDFDLCEACESSSTHPEDHELIKFKLPRARRFRGHHGGRDGGFGYHGPFQGGFGFGPHPPHVSPDGFGPYPSHGSPHSFGGPRSFGPHPSHGGLHGFGPHPHGHGHEHHPHGHGGRGGRWRNSQCPWNRRGSGAAAPEVVPINPLNEGLSAQFLRDVSLEDKTVLVAGSMHIKTWSIRNDGKQDWDNGVKLHYLSGNKECLLDGQTEFEVPALKSGETGDLSVPLIVPAIPGVYKTMFALSKDNISFGHHIWLEIVAQC